MKNLKDYIHVIENVIPNDLCQEILLEYQRSREWHLAGTVGSSNGDITSRNVNTIYISRGEIINNNDVRKRIDEQIFSCASIAIEKYREIFPSCQIVEDTGYELLRYTKGQFYKQHIDSFKEVPRHVSCSFALNDNYEGGEFAFFDREIIIKAPKGSALMFPSNFMYPHEIIPVTKGIRYSIITWFL
jgi:Rps23 Pro-64 3,4-dihydroxylase Tpa1-like proline 4-hydroxylase